MSTALRELAELCAATLHGDGGTLIHGAAPLGDADAHQITMIDGPEKLPKLAGSKAAAVLIPAQVEPPSGLPALVVENVHRAFQQIFRHFHPPRVPKRSGVSPHAHIDAAAQIDDDVEVRAGAVIAADVRIEAGVTIHENVIIMAGTTIATGSTLMPGVVVYEDTQIGSNCLIHANAVIGCYGFGYQVEQGRHQLGPQWGNVVIEPHVEIGAGTTIDRGAYGPTVIGEGTKIDNLVQIAHNCRIGKHNLICSQVGIAGSSKTGDYVVMAGQVGVRDHIEIGDQVVLGAMSGVANNVASGSVMMGIPATKERDQKLKQAALSKLPEMRRQFKSMQRQLEELKEQLEAGPGNSAAA